MIALLVTVGFVLFGNKDTYAPTTDVAQEEMAVEENEGAAETTAPRPAPAPAPGTPATVSAPVLSSPQVDHVVTYTGSEFTPSIVVISRGDTVQFTNVSNQPMRITSRSHSSLNQAQATGNGGSFTFTFSETGEWSFYNAESPTRQGRVVVNYD